jgi:endothelin-converting enzyme
MVQKIGYQTDHPNVSNPKQVQEYYDTKIRITPTMTWNQISEAALKSSRKWTWEKFLQPVDQLLWHITAPTVNAVYASAQNSISFPAGIMRSPVFSDGLPDYASYGSFGAVAGHELTHSFDDNGSQYDEKRRYRVWWDQSTKDHFHERTQCFIDQYSNYTIPGLEPGTLLNVDGRLTLSENVADSGGLVAAHHAWQKHGRNNAALPGLEQFNAEQMFFVSYGNLWCSKMREKYAIDAAMRDPHAPAGKRIIGTTANSAAFRKAFDCPVKKPTCELW